MRRQSCAAEQLMVVSDRQAYARTVDHVKQSPVPLYPENGSYAGALSVKVSGKTTLGLAC